MCYRTNGFVVTNQALHFSFLYYNTIPYNYNKYNRVFYDKPMPLSAQVETRSSTSHWGKDKSYAVWCWADGGNYFKSDLNDTPLSEILKVL